MNLNDLKKNWHQFGIDDPYWAILTDPKMKGNKWDEKEFFESGLKIINREVKKILRMNPDFRFHSALDFGCGAGRLTQGLAQSFDEASGVDIAPSMIKLANEKNKLENCKFFLNDKNDLSLFENEKFDFIFSIITLQHMLPKYAKNYIKEFLRILKPNGILKFQIPSKPDNRTELYHSKKKKLSHKIEDLMKWGKENKTAPLMEMYWIPIEEMVLFLTQNGARIFEVKRNNAAGEDFDSYMYIVNKI